MATWDAVARLALALPETDEVVSRDTRQWRVRGKNFVWERPLRATDRAHLGDAAPEGEIVSFRTADEPEKFALIEGEPELFFTTPHFDGYPMVLARLDALDDARLEELITEAWRARAPASLRRTNP